jgi:hypothetical protein
MSLVYAIAFIVLLMLAAYASLNKKKKSAVKTAERPVRREVDKPA